MLDVGWVWPNFGGVAEKRLAGLKGYGSMTSTTGVGGIARMVLYCKKDEFVHHTFRRAFV